MCPSGNTQHTRTQWYTHSHTHIYTHTHTHTYSAHSKVDNTAESQAHNGFTTVRISLYFLLLTLLYQSLCLFFSLSMLETNIVPSEREPEVM